MFINNYRNHLTNIIRLTKRNYYLQRFSDFRLNTRKIWETINELTKNKRKATTSVRSIIHNNIIKSTSHEISDAFNDHFSNIAPELVSKLPHKNFL